jgi:hypothetical protein
MAFWRASLVASLHLVFLAQQTVLAFDAIIRSLIRRFITGERLLEWETAAQAEMRSGDRTGVDSYLSVMPLLAVGLAALVWLFAAPKAAIFCAAPILILWAVASPVTAWLNRPPRERQQLAPADRDFLLISALRIWRYFHEYGAERHNYLISDNVEEEGFHEAARISPTNIGLLLNARQAACELGFLTRPEFALLTSHSLTTIARLDKFRGHLYNWYDTQSLQPLTSPPSNAPFISSVDSGNMAASLYTLHAGAQDLAAMPLLQLRLFTGLRTHWHLMCKESTLAALVAHIRLPSPSASAAEWIKWLPAAQSALASGSASTPAQSHDAWWTTETPSRIEAILTLLRDYLPWALPEYESLHAIPQFAFGNKLTLLSIEEAILFANTLDERLANTVGPAERSPLTELGERLRAKLPAAVRNLRTLAENLSAIAENAELLAEAMDFSFLVNEDRQLLSIGYDMGTQRTFESCYDLIASEARVATFLAVARDDLPQQSWFKLARDHTYAYGCFILLSWTGTMFEYLMPALWMRSYPGTLLARTQDACVHVQRAFTSALNIPWGISESGDSTKDDAGHYHYYAYGVPRVALSTEATGGPVIAPYSTFLALSVDAPEALRNLRRMASAGWVGAYGFYESVDYRTSPRSPVAAREWMAHHQGMSLLAVTNLLRENVIQRWFHANPLVQSTERLLHEVPVSESALRSSLNESAPMRAD